MCSFCAAANNSGEERFLFSVLLTQTGRLRACASLSGDRLAAMSDKWQRHPCKLQGSFRFQQSFKSFRCACHFLVGAPLTWVSNVNTTHNCPFLGVVSHHLLAFLVKTVFHHPVDVLAVQQSSFLHGSLQTAADVVDIRLHPVLFWMFFDSGSSAMLPTNSHAKPSPCAPCARQKSHVDYS